MQTTNILNYFKTDHILTVAELDLSKIELLFIWQ